MKIRIYTVGKRRLIGQYQVRSSYEGRFYHRMMPTLSAKHCRGILDTISPHCKLHSEYVVMENVETGYTGSQYIHRTGTILNF